MWARRRCICSQGAKTGVVWQEEQSKAALGFLAPGSTGKAEILRHKLGSSHREEDNVANTWGLQRSGKVRRCMRCGEPRHGASGGLLRWAGRTGGWDKRSQGTEPVSQRPAATFQSTPHLTVKSTGPGVKCELCRSSITCWLC